MKRFILFVLILAFATALSADDWTQWRGPNRNGVTLESGWNPAAIKEKSTILWTQEVGMGHSAVVIKDDRLYTMGNRHVQDEMYEDVVWCLSAETGSVLWQKAYACHEGEDPGPGATPLLDGNRLYTLSREGHIHCLNADNGEILWMKHLVEENIASIENHWFCGSPLIHDRFLVIAANQAGMVLDKNTGEMIWSSPQGNPGFGSPVLFIKNGQKQILLKKDRHLCAMDLETGQELWKHRQGWGDADPIVMGDKILITGQHTTLLDLSGGSPEVIWKNEGISWQFQSAAVHENHAYGFGRIDWKKDKQAFYCFDIRDGVLKWTQNLKIYGSSIIAGKYLVILTGQGKLKIAETTPDEYREIVQTQAIKMQRSDKSKDYRRECHCWTNPVLANSRIYARNSFGRLVCVDVRE